MAVKLDYIATKEMLEKIFVGYGFSDKDSSVIVDSLLAADLAGIESHGIQRMVRYDDAICNKMVDVNAEYEILHQTPLSAVIDAHKAMGQLVSVYAMNLAIEKAKKSGIGIVAVKNSNHFGIAGYYARMATEQGMIGMASTNSEAIMVPTNSRRAMLGTNPIAVAFPADPVPFCYDGATTVVTRGKLEVYNKNEESIPYGWAADKDGEVCTDPGKVISNIKSRAGGGILPVGGGSEETGGHKGYGFGMISELFTSVIAGGPASYDSYKEEYVADTSHSFCAIDLKLFGSVETVRNSCSKLLEDIRHATPSKEGARVYIHGEKEIEFADKVIKEGIPANEKTVEELKQIAKNLNIAFLEK